MENMFKNQSLETRIFTAFIFMAALVLIMCLIGWMGTASVSNSLQDISKNSLPSITSLGIVSEGQTQIQSSQRLLINPRSSADLRKKELTILEQAWKQINQGFQDYEKTPRNSEEEKIYQAVKPAFEKWKAASQDILQLNSEFDNFNIPNPTLLQIDLLLQGKRNSPEFAKAQSASEVISKMNNYINTQGDAAFLVAKNALNSLIEFNKKFADEASKKSEQAVTASILSIVIAMIVGPVVAVIFGRYFSNTIAKPMGIKIASVVEAAKKIALGDLTAQVAASEQKDEIGELQTAFHKMNQDLNKLIKQVQQSGIQITTSATQIAASGKQLEATVNEQVASTNQVVATAKEISATSTQLVKTMDKVSQMSELTANSASGGQKDLTKMGTTMSQLAQATGSISGKLGVISDKANNINSIIITITKVADQTNLLSLNAAIEAEKAGEYGTGFAVVAREIRRLADQTAVATLDIENMVKEMQSAVSVGVMEMDKFTRDVNQGVENIHNVSEQLAEVIEQVQSLNPQFEAVNQGMEEQTSGAKQISEAMEQLSESSMQTADSLRDINNSIYQLNEAAQNLRQEISRFKIAV
jgi:methyl-accepting chemotaxis protein WspA